ncbi:hypothetical protein NQ317_010338, partial [Molorchus minor]
MLDGRPTDDQIKRPNGHYKINIQWTSILHPQLIDVHESKAGVRRLPSTHHVLLCPIAPDLQKNIRVQNVLRFSINSRQSVFNTVYSVRCLSCLRVKGSFQEAALIIFPSTPIKNTEDGMKRWLRRAKKRVNRTYESKEHY